MPYKYNVDTPAKDVIKVFKQMLTHCLAEVEAFHQGTVAANGTALDMAQNLVNESWVLWDLFNLGKQTHPDIRRVLVNKLVTPLRAYVLYHIADWLTEEEKATLEGKFADLTAHDKELADEILKEGLR